VGQFSVDISIDDVVAPDIPVVVCRNVKGFYLSLDACKSLHIVGPDFPQPCHRSQILAVESLSIPVPVQDQSVPEVPSSGEVWPDRHIWIQTLSDSPELLPDHTAFSVVDRKLRSVYADVFDDSVELRPMCGPVVGEPMRITLKDGYKPFAIHAARQVPYALQDKRKFYFDRSTRPQTTIPSGSHVLVQDPTSLRWDKMAQVVGTEDKRRYQLRFPSGRSLWRNRKFLRLIKNLSDLPEDEIENMDTPTLRRSTRRTHPPDRFCPSGEI
ncbi:hypothetical protein TCAL_08233, partial [Tigriopus californicus]